MKKESMAFRLSAEARGWIRAIAAKLGISQAVVIEQAVRSKAKAAGVLKKGAPQ